MFTGIVQALGRVRALTAVGAARRLRIDSGELDLGDVRLGDSMAVNGACLTVAAFDHSGFEVDVSTETLTHTTLGQTHSGAAVNLEKALRLADRLGGHLVSGHVDGVGQVIAMKCAIITCSFGFVHRWRWPNTSLIRARSASMGSASP